MSKALVDKAVIERAIDALSREQVMAQDDKGDYTVNVTPKHVTSAISELREAIAAQAVEPATSDDKPDEWSAEIDAHHPLTTGAHKQYTAAMQMVGNRRSKGALVDLVCWLLQKAEKTATAQAVEAWMLTGSHEIFHASNFTPDAERNQNGEWTALCKCTHPAPAAKPLSELQKEEIAQKALKFGWIADYGEAIDFVIEQTEAAHGIKEQS